MGFRLVLKVVNHDPCEAYLSKPNLLRRRVWRFHSLQSPFLLCIYHHNQSRSLSSVLQSFYSGKTKPNICSNNVLTKVEMIKQLLRLPKIGMALTKSFSETLTALLQSCLCVCVCLKFGDCGSLDQHGFARNKIWLIDENPPPLASNESFGKSFVDLLLKSTEEDLKQWPHSFKFRLKVSLAIDGDLTLVSRVRNINGKPFSFSFALCSLFTQ
ncbi:unnamed protein product [Brassica rapa]|uniref:Uncharacterized protein n=2 Tax=Brassica TaxID=3705 RepID=A0A8D9CR96_BRACM|nr:unnamed protein product [Brassica napus]CAG7862311.1 unnamed protein product [Brassica rapa]